MSTAPGEARPTAVLLVEDDEGDAFLVRELLDEAGADFDVVTVGTVAEARDQLLRDVDCVLLDLGLPDVQGLAALDAVLEAAGSTAVLCLTGLDDEHRGTAAVAAGAQDYLVKGAVDGELLRRAVRYAVERKRLGEQLRRYDAAALREAENERLERGLLPHPDIRDETLTVTTRYQAGRDGVLGGDFYDVVETRDGTLYVLMGDVAGHGPDEAALGVCLRIAWRTLVLSGVERDRLLPVLEDVLVRERRDDEVFATLCMVVVGPDREQARVFLAGHPAPLLLGEHPQQLPDDLVGPALGVLPGVIWGSRTVELGPTWRLALFTDGIIEGRTGEGAHRLGVEGLLELARTSPHYAEAGALVDGLISSARELHREPLSDDVAVVVVARR